MKTLLFIVSLATALIAMPVVAQQGPAGVPGAPGLAPNPASAPLPPAPPPEPAKPVQRSPASCRTAKNVEQCKARQEAQRKALEACQGKAGNERKRCLRDNLTAKK